LTDSFVRTEAVGELRDTSRKFNKETWREDATWDKQAQRLEDNIDMYLEK
jgi:hypothetical protein